MDAVLNDVVDSNPHDIPVAEVVELPLEVLDQVSGGQSTAAVVD